MTDGQTDGPTDRQSGVWSRIARDYKENDVMTMLLIIELGMKRFKKFELMQRELQLRPISVAIPTQTVKSEKKYFDNCADTVTITRYR